MCTKVYRYGRPLFHLRGNKCLCYIILVVVVLGVILMAMNLYHLHYMRMDESELASFPVLETLGSKQINCINISSPVVWIQGSLKSNNNSPNGYLKHVYLVFQKMGYSVGEKLSDWVIAWFHDYPFGTFADVLMNLKPYQKVNHFPGTGYITNKVSLAQTNFSFIPEAFELPGKKMQFLEYVEKHKNTSWVQKSNQHRGIQLKSVTDIDLTKNGSLVQEYISRPFLIDGRKFDIGLYTIITSINPLRVYFIDALFRFCPEEYYPFQSSIVDKYVVGDDYLPLWQMPSLKDLYAEKGFSFKNSFNEYLSSIGKDYKVLWKKLKSAIKDIILNKEPSLIASGEKYQSKRSFFELVRFDFLLDEDMNVFLMECNMSPNLSSDHFPQNAQLYEHVLFNVLNLVGAGLIYSNPQGLAHEDALKVSYRDIYVFPDYCKGNFCTDTCKILVCKLCMQCLESDLQTDLMIAFLEHTHKGSSHRIFPPSFSQADALKWSSGLDFPMPGMLNKKNKLLFLWFIGKCRLDVGWCS